MNYKGTVINSELTIDKIYTIHYFEYAIDFDFPGEIHDFWEAVYVDAGEVTVTAGTEKYVMRQGNGAGSCTGNVIAERNLAAIVFNMHPIGIVTICNSMLMPISPSYIIRCLISRR